MSNEWRSGGRSKTSLFAQHATLIAIAEHLEQTMIGVMSAGADTERGLVLPAVEMTRRRRWV
jgi:hypothetical protein